MPDYRAWPVDLAGVSASGAVHPGSSPDRGCRRDPQDSSAFARGLWQASYPRRTARGDRYDRESDAGRGDHARTWAFGLPRQRVRRSNLLHQSTPADLAQRRFAAERPNQLWFTDITEHPAREGKVYYCAILDAFSKVIVARTLSTVADTALVNNAVNMAVRERARRAATVLHADHGTQFTSWSFAENLSRYDLLASFGTVGDCVDNAVMESFWGRLPTELPDTRKWPTTLELTLAMADYIDNFYNVHRRHSYLGNVSPNEYEKLWHDIQPSPQLS